VAEASLMQQKSNQFQWLLSVAVSSMILSLLAACTSSSTDCPPNSAGQIPQACASNGRSGGSSGASYYRSGCGSSRSSGESGAGVTRSGRSGFGSFGGGRAGG
jgi:hypothetical protein